MTKGSYDSGPLVAYVKQKDYVIHISHVPTDKTVSFPAFLTAFEDKFSSDWNTTSVFGRMDPIYTFQQTSRTISLTVDVPSADENEAKQNLSNVRELTKFLYPTYQNNYNATTISKAPLVRIKFANLIGTNIDGLGPRGLLGKLNGAGVTPNNDAGYFDPGQMLYPKVLTLNLTFDVIHERNPGEWDQVVQKVIKEEEKKVSPADTAKQTATAVQPTTTSTVPAGSKNGSATSGLAVANTTVSKPEVPLEASIPNVATAPSPTPVTEVTFDEPTQIIGRPLDTESVPAGTSASTRIVDEEEQSPDLSFLDEEEIPPNARQPGDSYSVQDILSGKNPQGSGGY